MGSYGPIPPSSNVEIISDLSIFFPIHYQMAYFKVPRYWLFRDDFPKTVTGKVQKFRMREMTIKYLPNLKKLE